MEIMFVKAAGGCCRGHPRPYFENCCLRLLSVFAWLCGCTNIRAHPCNQVYRAVCYHLIVHIPVSLLCFTPAPSPLQLCHNFTKPPRRPTVDKINIIIEKVLLFSSGLGDTLLLKKTELPFLWDSGAGLPLISRSLGYSYLFL